MRDWLFLARVRQLISQDPAGRGLDRVPGRSLLSHAAGDFAAACRNLAEARRPEVAIVTGFYVARAECYETDGPLGALFLTEVLRQMGAGVTLISEAGCCAVLETALRLSGLEDGVRLCDLPSPGRSDFDAWLADFWRSHAHVTHLVAIERAGPSHSLQSLMQQYGYQPAPLGDFARDVDPGGWNRPYTMRGHELAAFTSPAHRLFETMPEGVATVGVGDGGNEIGMGRIPWHVIRDNIEWGGRIACRVPVRHLIVAGTSNWGAYALAAGIAWLKHRNDLAPLFDADREARLWEAVLAREPLVDGVTAACQLSVDGLEWKVYRQVLDQLQTLLQHERSSDHGVPRLPSVHG